MKKHYPVLLFLFFALPQAIWAQFPALEVSADVVTAPTASVVDVSVRAGTNWQNITTFNGSITFDTTVISYNQMSFWGLSFPQGATFTYHGGGVLSWTWTSLITIGPTLSPGDIVFTLQFNVVGGAGAVSPVSFGSNPQPLFWYNGFGWSGNNFNVTDGSVTVFCGSSTAAFTSSSNFFTVNFTDQSSPSPNSHFWDFGDGNSSAQANPTHTYATGGSYTVCLTVADSCGADSSCQTIAVCTPPTAAFADSSNGLAYTFTDLSTDAPTSWLWDFGDGNTSTLQNPSHTYANVGPYTVCLTSSSPCGSDSVCMSVMVSCPAPVANYGSTISGLTVQFGDLSMPTATIWLWDFGDGNTSLLQSPSHTYAAPGTYGVCLLVSNVCGTGVFCDSVTVSCPAPVADFYTIPSGTTVTFVDQSTLSPTAWAWDFGDGGSSNNQFPIHTYAADGTYLVCLTASSICGSGDVCDTVTINTVGLPELLPETALSIYPNPSSGFLRAEFVPKSTLLRVTVLDMLGKSILRQDDLGTDMVELDLSGMPGGVYFILLEGEAGQRVEKLLLE